MEKPTFQEVLLGLQEFWAKQGCVIWQPLPHRGGRRHLQPGHLPAGAGARALERGLRRALHPAHRRPLRREPLPAGALLPVPGDPQALARTTSRTSTWRSLEHLGIDPAEHDVRFVEDDWESPTLGAWGLGWEVWIDGMECTQFTYFQQVGGIDLDPLSVELTYGTERLAMYLQGVDSVFDLEWVPGVTYGDVLQGQRGPVVGLQLRRWPTSRCCSAPSPTTSRSARAAWRAGWRGRRTTSCSSARTRSTCSTPGAPSASPSAPATSPGCATWPARWPRPTWPSWTEPSAERRRRQRRAAGCTVGDARRGVDLTQGPMAPRLPARDRGRGDARPRPAGRPSTCCPTGWPACSPPRASTWRRTTSK